MGSESPEILIVLPLAFQDGIDKHSGIMRYLNEKRLSWSIRIDRLTSAWDRPRTADILKADGAIVDGGASARLLKAYAAADMPLVAIDWRDAESLDGRRRLAVVASDDETIGRTAAKAVLDICGQSSAAYMPTAEDMAWSAARGRAFAKTLAESGVRATLLNARAPLAKQLRELQKPAAIFSGNDVAAAKVLKAAQEESIAVPGDLAVLGVDNERFTCLHTTPPLASIQPDFELAGYLAAKTLDLMLQGRRHAASMKYGVKDVICRRSMEPSGTAGRLVQRAKEIIRDSYAEIGGIDEIARRLSISRRLLDRRFRQIEGRSVLDAVREMRLDETCRLLRTTKLPIAAICDQCSLGSGTYPLRVFKRRFGMTMRQYRLSPQ